MRLPIHRLQCGGVQVRVALGGAEPRMPQQLLDATQVSAPLQQVRGE
jgi:hypothetical protein